MSKYHFIAIGGIGMSGLAKYLLQDGHTVSGSDIEDSKYVDKLRALGAKIYIGHNAENVPSDAIVIKSTAIRDNNPEVMRARELGLKIYHRSDLLSEIANMAQNSGKCFIGFSGTHGKTTTSGLASYVLDKAALQPSFIDGGIVPELNTNAQHLKGKHFVAELDESDGTIIKYNPDILVINNLEADHLDFYKNGLSDLIKTFENSISKAKKVIINIDNQGIQKLKDIDNAITFGLHNADYSAKNINYTKSGTEFEIWYKNEFLTNINIQLAGIHNVYNTLAVCVALIEAGVDINLVKPFFYNFTGMGRRFQKVCEFSGIQVYDDYAHHPTEIKATLDAAALKYGKEHIVAVFQPHRYTRLKSLWDDFKTSFNSARVIYVTDVYSASEDKIEGISGENFASELPTASYVSGSIEDVAQKIMPMLKNGDIVVGLGAGTITRLGKNLEKAGCVAN